MSWRDLAAEAIIIALFWGLAVTQDFASLPLAAAILVTAWLVGSRLWRVLRAEISGPQQTEPIRQSTLSRAGGVVIENAFILAYPWLLAAREGLNSFWGALALLLTAIVAISSVRGLTQDPVEPELDLDSDPVSLEPPDPHEDPRLKHEFPTMPGSGSAG